MVELFGGQPAISADGIMATELAADAGHHRKGRYCCQFPGRPIQYITLEKVTKKMSLKKLVNGWRKLKQCPSDRFPNKPSLILCTACQTIPVLWHWGCIPACFISNAFPVSVFQHGHQGRNRIQTSGKSTIGIKMS